MSDHPKYCHRCQEFHKFLLARDRFREHVLLHSSKERVPAQTFLLFSNVCDLPASAKLCSLCHLILRAINRSRYNGVVQPEYVNHEVFGKLNGGPLELRVHRYEPDDEIRKIHNLGRSDEDPAFYLHNIEIMFQSAGDDSVESLDIRAAADSVAAKSGVIYRRPPLPTSECEAAFFHIRNWLGNCLQNHVECRTCISGKTIDESSDPVLPTRVIDVRPIYPRDDTGVRLLESKGRCGQYVTLSHCWGPTNLRPLSTTQTSIHAHMKWILFDALPKSFQDAVTVTRELGIRYLWIDSLCIIQGDTDDWLKESKAMGHVYENSRMLIAVSGAANSREGCFLRRPKFEHFVELPYLDKAGDERGSFIISEMYPPWTPSRESRPLSHRAWCLQEGILARRILHYTKEGIWWSCKLPGQQVLDEMGDWSSIAIISSTWDQLVISYTDRSLTYHSDKLAALDGLATELSKIKKGDYLQGLWTCDFPNALFWTRLDPRLSRPQGQSFASWSWASTEGRITWLSSCRELQDFRWNSRRGSVKAANSNTLSVLCPVKKVYTGPEPVNAHEKYPLPPEDNRFTAEQHFTYLCNPYYPMYDQNNVYIGIAVFDETAKKTPKRELMCLVMIEEEPADENSFDSDAGGRGDDRVVELCRPESDPHVARARYKRHFGLLVESVEPVSSPPYHVRVGIGLILNPDAGKSLDMQDVMIR